MLLIVQVQTLLYADKWLDYTKIIHVTFSLKIVKKINVDFLRIVD